MIGHFIRRCRAAWRVFFADEEPVTTEMIESRLEELADQISEAVVARVATAAAELELERDRLRQETENLRALVNAGLCRLRGKYESFLRRN